MKPVRIACVRYLNTLPLIEGLGKLEGLELLPAVPSRICAMVTEPGPAAADIGLVSLIDAVRSPVPLAMLPAGMIGCDGPTLTVRLFSAVPLNQVRALHADTDSHTSVVLARILLARRFGVTPPVIDFDARERISPGHAPAGSLEESWPETVLIIGDKVVVDAPPADRYPHQLDLGQAWKDWTGLPFVYAVWMCKRERANEDSIQLAAALLHHQLLRNRQRIDWLVAARAPEHRWPTDIAADYLGRLLRYTVGPREREAVDRFLAEAAALGLAHEGARAHWAELRANRAPQAV